MVKRVGLFGGTFNPIHTGHLRAAEEVKTGFALDCIYFIPAALPPHKDTAGLVEGKDRQEMIARAIATNPGFALSDAELRRRGRSYTIDTIKAFQEGQSADTSYYLIIGMDQFFEIDTWKACEALFEQIPFIVMTRPSESGTNPLKRLTALGAHARRHVDAGYYVDADQCGLRHEFKQPIWFHEVTSLSISSSKIRMLIKSGRSIKYLVPEAVEEYILEKDLYRYGA